MGITDKEQRIARFFAKLDAMLDITARQLHERMEFTRRQRSPSSSLC